MATPLLFEELLPLEFNEIINNPGIVYLPLGALEWHSKHLPFGLDAFVSYELCKRSCALTGGCIIPPLYFGTDREHNVNGKMLHGMDARANQILPGSIYFIKMDLFSEFLRQIIQNISDQGFKKLAIVSAHSGAAQQEVLEELAKNDFGNLKLHVFPGSLFEGSIDHAGPIETALLLAINQSLVHPERIDNKMGPIRAEGIQTVTAKEGEERINKIVQQIVKDLS